MLKKSAVLIAGLALAGCQQQAGGNGYFDSVDPTFVVEKPVVLVPVLTEEPDNTEALTEAVEAAIIEGEADGTDTATLGEDETEAEEAPAPATISTDDGTLDLNVTSQEQQKIERDKAAVFLAAARAQYVIIEPGALPDIVAGVNIALYARETTNAIGEKLYKRPFLKLRLSVTECGKFATPDDAQRYFLANDGPVQDPLNLDPDGDGFACSWSPEYYRALR
ncbi:MAG: hypothetical protein AAED33_08415 [Paracoccaceae bacterium]|jgi:hypothetical protein